MIADILIYGLFYFLQLVSLNFQLIIVVIFFDIVSIHATLINIIALFRKSYHRFNSNICFSVPYPFRVP